MPRSRINHVEMRTAKRHRVLQRCFVQAAGGAAQQAWPCIVFSVSDGGVGVTLPVRLPEGTVLTIQAWGLPRARTLKARVVQAKKVDALWFTGCELPTRLTDVELQIWRSGPRDWVDDMADGRN